MASDFMRTTVEGVEVFHIKPTGVAMGFYYALAYPTVLASAVLLGSLAGAYGALLGVAVAAWTIFVVHDHVTGPNAPVELRVVPEGLRVSNGIGHSNTLFPLFDIAELSVWDPRETRNAITPSLVPGPLRITMNERPLELRLRKRSHSKVVTIAGGLTRNASCALLSDLRSVLGARSVV